MNYTVYYWKDPMLMADVFLHNKVLTPESLESTHTKLGTFSAKDMEDLFRAMQAEVMPPMIYNMVQSSNPSHTSMSVGDVIQEGEDYFLADVCGFSRLEKVKACVY